MNKNIEKEVMTAYCDIRLDFEVADKLRNLNFVASQSVSPQEAKRIMTLSLGEDGGYNEFNPDVFDKFPVTARIVLAREYGVAIYVYDNSGKPLPKPGAVKADECSKQSDGSVRYWWD